MNSDQDANEPDEVPSEYDAPIKEPMELAEDVTDSQPSDLHASNEDIPCCDTKEEEIVEDKPSDDSPISPRRDSNTGISPIPKENDNVKASSIASEASSDQHSTPDLNVNTSITEEISSKEAVESPTQNLSQVQQSPISRNSVHEILQKDLSDIQKLSELKQILLTQGCTQEIKEALFFLLLHGPLVLHKSLLLYSSTLVKPFLSCVEACPLADQVELWKIFSTIVKSNKRNLVTCCDAQVCLYLLEVLPRCSTSADLQEVVLDLLTFLVQFSISVKELTALFRLLKAENNAWRPAAIPLLSAIHKVSVRPAPDEFFSFPGKLGSTFQLPPISKWPTQSGWSISVWFNMDELANLGTATTKPYLYSFRTGKGLGYSCYFVNNSLSVVSMKAGGRGLENCVPYAFRPCRWYMTTLVFVYNRWSKSEVRCYVDGQLIAQLEQSWTISTNEVFDRCFIGSSSEQEVDSLFCGQISSVYGFADVLTPQQISAMFALGPAYKGQFKFESEAPSHLSQSERKVVYEGSLNSALIFSYNPVSCDSQLCLNQAPKTRSSLVFQHSPHAIMIGEVKPVLTRPLHSTLHSLGGVAILYPLFGQLDCLQADEDVFYDDVSALLFGIVCDLLHSTPAVQQQILQSRGFLVIRQHLELATPRHVNEALLQRIVLLARNLIQIIATFPSGAESLPMGLLRQLFDHLLFCPALWIRAPQDVQCHLYHFLASEFLKSAPIFNGMRRVSSVLISLHTLKSLYWITPFTAAATLPQDSQRPDMESLNNIRTSLLVFVKHLIMRGGTALDEQLQPLLHYLSCVQEDNNLGDVLYITVLLMNEIPQVMVPSFDKLEGLKTVFKLVSSLDESIRVYALKLLAIFLSRSTQKRKADAMMKYNLYSLLGERLLQNASHLTLQTYNALFEILTERISLDIVEQKHSEVDQSYRLENPLLLKVIANMISWSKPCPELEEIRVLFLSDLIALCSASRDNRRMVLQMSVWQDWLLSLSPLLPRDSHESDLRDMILSLFRMLLHHAIKFEYGGWRVWIDTLAILHTRVSKEEFQRRNPQNRGRGGGSFTKGSTSESASKSNNGEVDLASSAREILRSSEETPQHQEDDYRTENTSPQKGGSQQSPAFTVVGTNAAFRVPEFHWSGLHLKMLNDLLYSIEHDLQIWKAQTSATIMDYVNSPDNQTYVVNVIHLIAQLTDMLITSAGGLLSLLAAATSANGEIDMLEQSHGLHLNEAMSFLLRLVNLADLVLFASSQSLYELEQEKNMASGGILRLALRLVFTCAVRNSLESHYRSVFGDDLPYRVLDGTFLAELKALETDEVTATPLAAADARNALAAQEGGGGAATLNDPQSRTLYTLIQGIIPRASEPLIARLQLEQSPIRDPVSLLQEMDVNRLRAVIYRDMEDTKQAQFLALSIVYFLSVLMVSRYRDTLEPNDSRSTTGDSSSLRSYGDGASSLRRQTSLSGKPMSNSVGRREQEKSHGQEEEHEMRVLNGSATNGEASPQKVHIEMKEEEHPDEEQTDNDTPRSPIHAQSATKNDDEVKEEETHPDEERMSGGENESVVEHVGVSSINTSRAEPLSHEGHTKYHDTEHLPAVRLSGIRRTDDAGLTERLQAALNVVAPLLREIFLDFAPFLSKTLLGSHGQELLSGGLQALKQSKSVIELVMLLCSQEWQNSLQKHAGLAFIELVNEGRLLAHSTRDHIVRISNEAEFILNRMRAEDVSRHGEFDQLCVVNLTQRHQEEQQCHHLIQSAKRRDASHVQRRMGKIMANLLAPNAPWGVPLKEDSESLVFYRLDSWEDDSRRRQRLILNPYGTSHPEATLRVEEAASNDQTQHAASSGVPTIPKEVLQTATLSMNGPQPQESESYGVPDEELTQPGTTSSMSARSASTSDSVPRSTQPILSKTASVSDSYSTTVPLSAVVDRIEVQGPITSSTPCILLAPAAAVHGIFSVTKSEVYFEMDVEHPDNQSLDPQILHYVEHLHGKWNFTDIRAIFTRRYLHRNVALELFVSARTAVMFAFPDQATVKRMVQYLPRVGVGVKYNLPQSRGSSLASPRQVFKLSNMTQRWQQREVSNFDYLMYLNTVAGRTYNDLNQYPIFPWVLANYHSKELNLSDPESYRDLSKPIGALNPARKAFFEERFREWDDDSQPAFHYGTHYSTAAFVLNYLLRVEPFTSLFLQFQGGRFDHADRCFHSVAQTWLNCQRDTSDVKELIPEFFYMPEMFRNNNNYCLGRTDEGMQVNDVLLPEWASTPEEFVRIHRQVLESEFVSCQLHEWIDLIFGYKQRGPEAVRATNVFCHLTYDNSVDWSKVTDPVVQEALEAQIRLFGQTPSQLLTEPHPPRSSALHVSPLMFRPVREEVCMMMKCLSNSPIVHLSAHTHPAVAPLCAVVGVTANHCYSINRWNHSALLNVNVPTTAGPIGSPITAPTPGSTSAHLPTSQPLPASAPKVTNPSVKFASPKGTGLGVEESQAILPLSMDTHLSQVPFSPKRHLGDNFDERLPVRHSQFAVTADNKVLFACGFWDRSFRAFSTDSNRLVQVVFGHHGVVTCLARSESVVGQDCYVVTGSEDCTVMAWLWSARHQAFVGENGSVDAPAPRAILTGHQDEISSVGVSAELGLIFSASLGTLVIHTTQGDLLRTLCLRPAAVTAPLPQVGTHVGSYHASLASYEAPQHILCSREGHVVVQVGPRQVAVYSLNGRLLVQASPLLDASTSQTDTDYIHALAMNRLGSFVLVGSQLGRLLVLRIQDLHKVFEFPRCDVAIRSLAVTHDQRFVVAGLASGCMVVFNVDFNQWHPEFQARYASANI